ncbi:MAG: hypothetical protein HY923_07030 [Elusimicrobia bacterium]|nr:hypothetical protein [Elusimicrobiota bacterium]
MNHLPLYDSLKHKSYAELETIMAGGRAPDAGSLVGWEYRGWSPAPWISLLGIRKFMKGFFRREDGLVEGYNVPVRQNGFDEDWIPKGKAFGFYHVIPPVPPDIIHPNSLLIQYGISARNPFWKPERTIRDYIAVIDPAVPDVMLGKAVVALGSARIQVSYFVLEKMGPARNWPN